MWRRPDGNLFTRDDTNQVLSIGITLRRVLRCLKAASGGRREQWTWPPNHSHIEQLS